MMTNVQYPLGQMANKAINPVWILHGDKAPGGVSGNHVHNSTTSKQKTIESE